MAHAAITTVGLTKRFERKSGVVDALTDVTIDLPAGSYVAVVGQRLTAVNAASAVQLTAALREAANDKATANAGGHSIGLAAAQGQGLIATVLPLQRGQRQSFQPFAAAVAVFVQNPANIPPLPGEAFARLYNLTPSELRVALALSPGLLPQEAADMLGISLATVKTHLSKVFEKTKTARQADLVALMMRAGSPVG